MPKESFKVPSPVKIEKLEINIQGFSKETESKKEILLKKFEKILEPLISRANKISGGKQGILATVDISDFSEEDRILMNQILGTDDLRTIILKLGGHDVKNEYAIQKTAVDRGIPTPKPFFCFNANIGEKRNKLLEDCGLVEDGKIAVIGMEYIPNGKDLARILYEGVLKIDGKFQEGMAWEELESAAQKIVGYQRVSEKDFGKADIEARAMSNNEDKLLQFLEKNGFALPLWITDQLREAINKMKEEDIVHGDLHPRNVMVDFENKKVLIVDWGLARMEKDESADYYLVRLAQRFNKEQGAEQPNKEFEKFKKEFLDDSDKTLKNKGFLSNLDKWKQAWGDEFSKKIPKKERQTWKEDYLDLVAYRVFDYDNHNQAEVMLLSSYRYFGTDKFLNFLYQIGLDPEDSSKIDKVMSLIGRFKDQIPKFENR